MKISALGADAARAMIDITGVAMVPLFLCVSHEKVPTPFIPLKW